MGAVTQALLAEPNDPRLAVLWTLLPALLLHRSPVLRGGRRLDRTTTSSRISSFQEGSWEPLLEALRLQLAQRPRGAAVAAQQAYARQQQAQARADLEALERERAAADDLTAAADAAPAGRGRVPPGNGAEAVDDDDAMLRGDDMDIDRGVDEGGNLGEPPADAPPWNARLGPEPTLPACSPDERQATERRVRSMVAEGELGRAARALTPQQMAPPNAATVAALRALHPPDLPQPPPPPGPEPAEPPAPPGNFVLYRSVFDQVVRTLPRFSGHGLDLTRFEHIRSLQRACPEGYEAFFQLASRIAAGDAADFSDELRRALGAARLVAFAKPHSGVRPIAVGSAWRRVMGRAVAAQRRAAWAEQLQPVQFGVGVSGGSELLVHAARALVAERPDWLIVGTDCRNAFNSGSRRGMLAALALAGSDILPFAQFFYGQDAALFFGAEDGVARLASRTGAQQGDPIAPFLFSLLIQPVLEELQATAVGDAEGARVLAYLDDVYLVGPRAWVEACYARMRVAYAALGLELRDDKGVVYSPHGIDRRQTVRVARRHADGTTTHVAIDATLGVPVAAGGVVGGPAAGEATGAPTPAGVVVVGSAVGTPAFERQQAAAAYAGAARLLQNISVALTDPQITCLLVRHCVLTRLTFAQRTLPPRAHHPVSVAFDDYAKSTFVHVLRTGPLGRFETRLLTLPLRCGGLGWTATAETGRFAFLASSLAALDAMCSISVGWRALALRVSARLGADGRSRHRAEAALQQAHVDVTHLIPAERLAAASYQADDLLANLSSTTHLQRRLSRAFAGAERARVGEGIMRDLRGVRRERAAARRLPPAAREAALHEVTVLGRGILRRRHVWRAACGWGATDYLAVLPDSTDYSGFVAMAPEVFRVTVALHLGIQYWQLARGAPRRCPCSTDGGAGCAELDGRLDVALSCGRAGHTFTHGRRHDSWRIVWGAFLRAHAWPSAEERRSAIRHHAPGCVVPDIMTWGPTGRLFGLDVRITHTTSPLLNTFGLHATRIAAHEREKLRLYRRSAWPQQPVVPVIVPLVASTFGGVGGHAQGFFRRVVRGYGEAAPFLSDALRFQNLNSGQHAVLWRRRICVALRIVVACQVLARVNGAAVAFDAASPDVARSSMAPWRRLQRRFAFAPARGVFLAAERAAVDGGVGGAYGGDIARPGVLGDGFPRSRPAD